MPLTADAEADWALRVAVPTAAAVANPMKATASVRASHKFTAAAASLRRGFPTTLPAAYQAMKVLG